MRHIMIKNHRKKTIVSMSLIITMFMLAATSLAIKFLINITLLNIYGTNHIILNQRATQAAKSGIEWGLVNIAINHSCFAPTTLTINHPGLNGLTVEINCTATTNYYDIYSRAIYGRFGQSNYVNKIINIKYAKTTLDKIFK